MAKLLSNMGWIKQAWRADPAHIEDVGHAIRYATFADYAFSDTAPGGSPCMNPPPQACRHADIRTGISSSKLKIGRSYFENIEANGQYIHIRAGTTIYNSLAKFYTSAYDPDTAQLSLTGRVARTMTGLISTALSIAIGIAFWPITAINFLIDLAKAASLRPRTKYAYLHATMLNTWRRTNIIATKLAINDGFIEMVWDKNTDGGVPMVGDVADYDGRSRQYMHRMFPDLFNKSGDLDVFATFTRWHRNNTARQKLVEKHADRLIAGYGFLAGLTLFGAIPTAAAVAGIYLTGNQIDAFHSSVKPSSRTLNEYQDQWLGISFNKPVSGGVLSGTVNSGDISTKSPNASSDIIALPDQDDNKGWWARFKEFFAAELDDGAAFMSFRVSETGASTMSLNNQTGESAVKSQMDSITESARSSTFNLAGGNIGDGVISSFVETLFNIGKATVSNIGQSFGLQIGGALAGGANIDFPQRYVSSASSLPTMSYTIELNATYNNPYCRLVQLWVPIAALIAISHPQQAGSQSYAPPPVVEVYDRGHAQTRYGIVQSVSFSIGEGSQSHNSDWKPSSAKATITFIDLSSIMYAPISEGFSFNLTKTIFDEDTAFTDYLAAISGVELYRQIYWFQKLKNRVTETLSRIGTATNPAHFGAMAGELSVMHLFDFLLPSHSIR